MKHVIRSIPQAANFYDRLLDALKEGDMLVDLKPHVAPRTRSQSRKLHAMITQIGDETGDSNMKAAIKQMDFWPQVYAEPFGQKPMIVPRSEADLTKEEESDIIERLYQLAAEYLPDFKFNQS